MLMRGKVSGRSVVQVKAGTATAAARVDRVVDLDAGEETSLVLYAQVQKASGSNPGVPLAGAPTSGAILWGPHVPDGIERVRVSVGDGQAQSVFEVDVRRGLVLPLFGRYVTVDVLGDEVAYTLPPVPVPGDVTVRVSRGTMARAVGQLTRTVRVGNVAPSSTSASFVIPDHAVAFRMIKGNAQGGTIAVSCYPTNSSASADSVALIVQASSARIADDVSQWYPLPPRVARFNVTNLDASVVATNVNIVFLLAL